MSDQPRFIHLRVHTSYSLLEGAVHVNDLVRICREQRAPAVAVTDTCNLFAALEFSEAAVAEGVQPIIGCQLELAEHALGAPRTGQGAVGPDDTQPVVLLAQDETGYGNLVRLSSSAFLESGVAHPHVSMEKLGECANGLICLTGGPGGPIGRRVLDGKVEQAQALLLRLADMFPDRLYVELQRHPDAGRRAMADELATEPEFLDMAYAAELPLVATNDVYFGTREKFAAHDALICIKEGAFVDQSGGRRRFTEHHCLKSAREMQELFSDLPEVVGNTVEIARRCAFRVPVRRPILPKLAGEEAGELRRLAQAGLRDRLAAIPMAAAVEAYEKRLGYELGVIENMGFPGYFLIVADVVQWARRQGIPVGPGRGSGAGSLVAYALTITDLDPLRYSLLFERFMNPDRVSMPDFDIDFCVDRRAEVIAYVQDRYGRDRVAQIITFGALLSRAAIRDVGRVLKMPLGQVDRLAKMIPLDGVKPVSVRQALRDEPRLAKQADSEEVVARMLDYAGQLEGLYRNASTHAAGVVIADRPLEELVPIYKDPRSDMPVTQFSMKWVEQAGLVKFDFLGLKTLTMIRNALDLLADRGVDVDIASIPYDDPKAYELYVSADTVAVFQVESAGMKDALKRMRPTCIEDIVALVALYRPGPMDNIPNYCNVKNGHEERQYLHESIDPILDETQGIIVYQEQVMQIAQDMAGYTLGGADMLRRAMGKKIQSAMDAEKPKFLEGAAANGVGRAKATEVWDLLNKFANYGFNKSHAVAYAVVSYQTAWLKANYPTEFMAAAMNSDIHNTEKLHVYRREVERLKVRLTPPCINRSDAKFTVRGDSIVYGLGGLKNIGIEAMKPIAAERDGGGPFTDLFDFARRVDLRRIGKRQLETMARAGVFDSLEACRPRVLEGIDSLLAYSATAVDGRNCAQGGLFGDEGENLPPPRLPAVPDWLPAERLRHEHGALGFYLTGHPLEDFAGPLSQVGVIGFAELEQRLAENGGGTPVVRRIAGTITGRQNRKSQKGNRFAFVQLSDVTGFYEVMVFSDVLEKHRPLLEPGNNVVLTVECGGDFDSQRLVARDFQPADDAISRVPPPGLRIFVRDEAALGSIATRLAGASDGPPNGARAPVRLVLLHPDLPGEVEIALASSYPLRPEVKGAVKDIPGVSHVEEFRD